MKKVYCKNCIFFIAQGSIFAAKEFYKNNSITQLRYRDGRCWIKPEIDTQRTDDAINHYEKVTVYLDNPYKLNQNNNCKYYKRKWYKFWVK